MSKHLQQEIKKIKEKMTDMSRAIEDRVYQATVSVISRDARLAGTVINGDAEIDRMEVDIEEACLDILTLFQPVATDLRFIVAVLKINNDLERIGDLAVNIAERAAFLAEQEPIDFPFDVADMAPKVEKMVSAAVNALINQDARLAYWVRAQDDKIDACNRNMYAKAKEEMPKHPEQVGSMLHALSIGRHLERIADHATNIAEDIIYLVAGDIIRHQPEVYEE